jgi:hypothetical protein
MLASVIGSIGSKRRAICSALPVEQRLECGAAFLG